MSRFVLIVALVLPCWPAVAQAGCFSGGQLVLRQPAVAPVQVQYLPQPACGQATVLPATNYGCSSGQAIVLREHIVQGRVVRPVVVLPRPSRLRLLLGF